jgi:phosphatidylglycerophosphatase A
MRGYDSKKLVEETRKMLDFRLQLINEELPDILARAQEKGLFVPLEGVELPDEWKKLEAENPNFKIPRIRNFGYHSIAEALFYDIITNESKRKRFPDLTLEKCQKVVDKFLRNREVCHHIQAAMLLDFIGDVRRGFTRLVSDEFGIEADSLFRGLMHTLVGDDGLYAVDETISEGIANLVVRAAEWWRSGDVSKNSPWAKIIDMASKHVHVQLDDVLCAIISACEELLDSERERAASPSKKLYKWTRKLLHKQLKKHGFTQDDLIKVVYERQNKYTYLQLDENDAKKGMEKVLRKHYACINILIMLTLHRVASKFYKVDTRIDSILSRSWVPRKVYRAYSDRVWLVNKAVNTISYLLMESTARLYGIVGLTNSGYYAKMKPGIFEEIYEASGRSPLFFHVCCVLVSTANGKVAHDTRTREELEDPIDN